MKKLFFMAMTVVLGMAAYSCSGQKTENQTETSVEQTRVLTVDNVLENADSLVGQEIEVEGVCSHLCKHGATKAFLLSNNSQNMLRAEATGPIDSFPKEAIHHVLKIKGTVVEDRVDEAAVQQMEESYRQATNVHGENVEVGCDAEKAAQGQSGIDSFAARMQDYRDKIAARQAKEGKAYLSFYHIDATGYEIVNDSIE